LRQAQAAWDEARFQYQSTVLNSFRKYPTRVSRQNGGERRTKPRWAAYQEAVQVANPTLKPAGQARYYDVCRNSNSFSPAQTRSTQTPACLYDYPESIAATVATRLWRRLEHGAQP